MNSDRDGFSGLFNSFYKLFAVLVNHDKLIVFKQYNISVLCSFYGSPVKSPFGESSL